MGREDNAEAKWRHRISMLAFGLSMEREGEKSSTVTARTFLKTTLL